MVQQSIFSQLTNAATRGVARNVDRRRQSGRVLFHSTFEDGFDGWRDHYDFKSPYAPISLTSYPTYSGGKALLLSTSDLPGQSRGASTYKNLSRYYNEGLVSFSGFFTTGSGRQALAWRMWALYIDTQAFDNSSRQFYRLSCTVRSGTDHDVTWGITGADGTRTLIRDSATVSAGENENKFNFDYVRLTVDLSANGGLGGYHEAQINNTVFDLTESYLAGVGTPSHPPQVGDPDTSDGAYASFAGGLNFGLGLAPATSKPDAYPAMLVCDDLMATVQD